MVNFRFGSCVVIPFLLSCSNRVLVFSEAAEEVSYDCVNPEGEYGTCIALPQCDRLSHILQETSINRESIKFLQDSTCGFSDEKVPQVCCPKASSSASNDMRGDTPPTHPVRPPTTEKTNTDAAAPSLNSTIIREKTAPEHPKGSVNQTKSSLNEGTPQRENLKKIMSHKNVKLLPSAIGDNCGISPHFFEGRIIGGQDATLGQYPWVVQLGYKDYNNQVQFACGGTLISKRYVLTASHCVTKLPDGFHLTVVKLGEYDIRTDPDCTSDGFCAPLVQQIGIEQIIPHEKYDKLKKKENDIALIRLKEDADIGTFVQPICLPRGEHIKKTEQKTVFIVAGFGRLTYDSPENSNILQEVKVPIVTAKECNKFYANREVGKIDESRFCAGGQEKKDSCKGDSGGPLMSPLTIVGSNSSMNTFQYGIVSLGPSRCGIAGQPALYTKVSYFMLWILDHIRP